VEQTAILWRCACREIEFFFLGGFLRPLGRSTQPTKTKTKRVKTSQLSGRIPNYPFSFLFSGWKKISTTQQNESHTIFAVFFELPVTLTMASYGNL